MKVNYLQITLWLTLLFLGGRQLLSKNEEPLVSKLQNQLPQKVSNVVEQALTLSTEFTEQQDYSETPTAADAVPGYKPVISKAASTSEAWPAQRNYLIPEPRILILEEDERNRNWTYQSQHFAFVSDAPLRSHVIREFATLFELTHNFCSKIPFSLHRIHGIQTSPMMVYLFEDYEHYVARGGVPGSGGVYLTQQDAILVPFEGLGLKKNNGRYSLDVNRTNQTLIHEATHMIMRGNLLQAAWFVEGSAEYVSTIPIFKTQFRAHNHRKAIVSYITSYGLNGKGGHNLGNRIELPPLKKLFESSYDRFQNLPHAYPYSLLVFYYYAHSDEGGNALRLRNYARALQEGATDDTAREILLAGRDYRTLQKLLSNSWAKDGIHLTFSN